MGLHRRKASLVYWVAGGLLLSILLWYVGSCFTSIYVPVSNELSVGKGLLFPGKFQIYMEISEESVSSIPNRADTIPKELPIIMRHKVAIGSGEWMEFVHSNPKLSYRADGKAGYGLGSMVIALPSIVSIEGIVHSDDLGERFRGDLIWRISSLERSARLNNTAFSAVIIGLILCFWYFLIRRQAPPK